MSNDTIRDNKRKYKNKLGYIDPTVAGIDIGAENIYVSIPNEEHGSIVVVFGATTPELKKIVDALKKASVITAVMEATGVYWIPLYEILEEAGLQPILVDAKSVQNVPGRKTDTQDCQWIQVLYSNGMLRAAYRPPRDRLKLRAYVRQRSTSIKTKQYALLHIEKALQLMNIKLSGVLGEIASVSGMAIIRAIVQEGVRDPSKLAMLRNSRVKKSQKQFEDALSGNYQEEHLFALEQALGLYDFADTQLRACDKMVIAELEKLPDATKEPIPNRDKDKKANGKYSKAQKPRRNELSFDAREMLWRKSGIDLTALPGIQASTALTIFSELGGCDVSAWDSVGAFASWLKLCPGNNITGGKSRKSKRQPCANRITQGLRMASLSAKKSKTSVGAFVRRVSGRADKPKGIKAGAHKLARMVYQMCKYGWKYFEKGEQEYENVCKANDVKRFLKKAKELGFAVSQMAA